MPLPASPKTTSEAERIATVPLSDVEMAQPAVLALINSAAEVEAIPPTPTGTSIRLPAFPPHAVVKTSQSPEKKDVALPPPSPAGEGEEAGQVRGEGLRWNPRPKLSVPSAPGVVVSGKGDGVRSGWGNLPQNLLRIVLSYAAASLPVHVTLRNRWQRDVLVAPIIVALNSREWLANIRRVSPGWRRAIDHHPHWYTLINLLYPSYDPATADPPPKNPSARSGSKTITVRAPTPFQRAKRVCSQICIPCTVAYPTHPHPFPAAHRDAAIWIHRLGWVRICAWHDDQFCHACLLSNRPPHGNDRGRSVGLQLSTEGDIDEADEYRSIEAYVCELCRFNALDSAIIRQLRSCARGGGVIRGDKIQWNGFSEYTDYIATGNDTARSTAEVLVAMWSLMSQTRFTDLTRWGRELQGLEFQARMSFYNGQGGETREARARRWKLTVLLQPYKSIDVEVDEEVKRKTLLNWDWELRARGMDLIEELKEEAMSEALNAKFREVVSDAAMNHFVAARIRSGIWVLPSTEADILSAVPRFAHPRYPPGDLFPLAPLAHTVVHPFPSDPTILALPKPDVDHPKLTGIFRLDPPAPIGAPTFGTEYILPPHTIVQALDTKFMVHLRGLLWPAMRRLMAGIVDAVGDDQTAETVCAGMSVREVLEGLRGQQVWFTQKAANRRERDEVLKAMKEAEAEAAATATVTEAEGLDVDIDGEPMSVTVHIPAKSLPDSPRVELVLEEEEEEGLAPVSSIIEVHHEEPVIVNPASTLGKRKTPPADLAQEGEHASDRSRQARRSREGSAPITGSTITTATSTSTPEDVVMPITPEDVIIEALQNVPDALTAAEKPTGVRVGSPIKAKANLLVVEVDGEAQAGGDVPMPDAEAEAENDDDASTVDSDGSGEIGRGADGHYETSYEGGDDADMYADDLALDLELRRANESMDQANARGARSLNRILSADTEDEELDELEEDFEEEEEEEEEEEIEVEAPPASQNRRRNTVTRSLTPGSSALSSYDDDGDDDGSYLSSAPSGTPGPFPAAHELHVSMGSIPYIPLPGTEDAEDPVMRVLAKEVIMGLWWDVRKPLRVCRCRVCERSRAREKREDVNEKIARLLSV